MKKEAKKVSAIVQEQTNVVNIVTPVKKSRLEWKTEVWYPIRNQPKISVKSTDESKGILCESIDRPKRWRIPRIVAVSPMHDIFHEGVPFGYIDKVMDAMVLEQHIYVILTENSERMVQYFATRPVPNNAWIGVTIDSCDSKIRIDHLRSIGANVKFLSIEPFLGLGELNLDNIDWALVGATSLDLDAYDVISNPQEWLTPIRDEVWKGGALFFYRHTGIWGTRILQWVKIRLEEKRYQETSDTVAF